MIHSKKFMFFVIGISAVFVFTGCDQVNELLGRNTEPTTKAVSTPNTSSSDEVKKVSKDETSKNEPLSDNEIALVGHWRLSKAEFDERLQNVARTIPDFDPEDIQAQALILDELIRQQLLVQEAEQLGLHKRKDLQQAVEDFRRTLLVQQLSQDLTEDIIVTAEDARAFYNENQENFIVPVEYKVRELVTYTEQGAKDLLVQILQGADFAALAQQQSKAESAAKGGDLGYIIQASSPKVQSTIETLNVGGVSNVFEGPDGFYIIKLEDKRGGEPTPFDEIQEQLIQNLTLQRQQQAILQRLSDVAQQTTIEINEDYFGSAEGSVPEE